MNVEQANRLLSGGRIDRDRPLRFSFNGESLSGYAGDTLASALLANGVDIVGRSFKYHRPRGIIGAGSEEPNAIVQLGSGDTTHPAMRATQVELYEGLRAESIRGWPSVKFDLMALNNLIAPMIGAGFYYKTMMWPRFLWAKAEHVIRRTTGMGRVPEGPDPDRYDHYNAHCDVLIAGGGPSGLQAALSAARAGARVIIADEQNEFGGRLLNQPAVAHCPTIDGAAPLDWVAEAIRELSDNPDVVVLPRSTVFGYYDHNFLTILQRRTDHLSEHTPGQVRQRQWRVRARQVVLAQGAFERPLVFGNNDLPGVMLASAVDTYVNRYAVAPGRRALIATNNDSAYSLALALHHAGVQVAGVVDCRDRPPAAAASALSRAGVGLLAGHAVSSVQGSGRVSGAELIALDGSGRYQAIDCDLVAVSGGWSPAVHLHSQAGGDNRWDDALQCFVPNQTQQANRSAGAGNGAYGLADCLQQGQAAGLAAAQACGFDGAQLDPPTVANASNDEVPLQPLWRVPGEYPERGPKQFVDFQNDVSLNDIRLAVREGYQSIEHVKRYTAMGFGTDQGRLGNIIGMALVAEALDKSVPEVGTTTFRPAYTPVTFGAGAGENVGELFDPVRKTALHGWHQRAGAEFEVVGQWLRPWYFPKTGEDLQAAVARECRATRDSVAIMDASTLGKIEVHGPDALTFLERMYTHNIAKLKPGRCAYGIMLGEDGMVMDDGVMACMDDNHYYLTTTTGGAAAVFGWLERWLQTEWPELDVYLTSVTDHWAAIAVVGPDSRKVLEKLDSDIDFSKDSFEFMDVKTGTLAGVATRVFRISFSGELAFEINVNSDDALAMWQTLMEAGAAFNITPYGTETLHVLRAEKGFVIVGQDTDGSVTPVDLGMNWLLSKDKDYIGKRSLARSDCMRDDRKQFVGLLSVDGGTVLPEGAQLIADAEAALPVPLQGHVTSSYQSACLGHPIALAMLERGHQRKGERLIAAARDGRKIEVEVASPVFYDPKGERQRV